jgi:hypothetical protein
LGGRMMVGMNLLFLIAILDTLHYDYVSDSRLALGDTTGVELYKLGCDSFYLGRYNTFKTKNRTLFLRGDCDSMDVYYGVLDGFYFDELNPYGWNFVLNTGDKKGVAVDLSNYPVGFLYEILLISYKRTIKPSKFYWTIVRQRVGN